MAKVTMTIEDLLQDDGSWDLSINTDFAMPQHDGTPTEPALQAMTPAQLTLWHAEQMLPNLIKLAAQHYQGLRAQEADSAEKH